MPKGLSPRKLLVEITRDTEDELIAYLEREEAEMATFKEPSAEFKYLNNVMGYPAGRTTEVKELLAQYQQMHRSAITSATALCREALRHGMAKAIEERQKEVEALKQNREEVDKKSRETLARMGSKTSHPGIVAIANSAKAAAPRPPRDRAKYHGSNGKPA